MIEKVEDAMITWLESLRGTPAGKRIGAKRLHAMLHRRHLRHWPVPFRGMHVYLNPDDRVITPMVLSGIYEPAEFSLLEKVVQPGDAILDIGANIGLHTLVMSRIAGEAGHVVSFEPEVVNQRYLKRNLARNGFRNVTVVGKAVCDTSGPKTFFINPLNTGDHRLHGDGSHSHSVTVDAVSIDDYLGADKRVDLIKMDIQGGEADALRGMAATLDANPALCMMFEFWPYGLHLAGRRVEDVLGFIHDRRFDTYLIDEEQFRLTPMGFDGIMDRVDQTVPGYRFEDTFNIFCARGGKQIPETF